MVGGVKEKIMSQRNTTKGYIKLTRVKNEYRAKNQENQK